jgi:AraC family transcriptional activator of mtrCDE
MLDLLSDILRRLSVKGTLYFRTAFTPPWGVEVPAFQNVARFHFAHRGDCMVRISDSSETLMLAQGDLVIIPHGAAHSLYSEQTNPEDALPLDHVLEASGFTGEGVWVHGGEGSDRQTQLICGHFSFAANAKHLIFDRLPTHIHIPNYGETAGKWLETTLRIIGDETGGARIGGDLIALKMSEAIFAQALRTFIESEGANLAKLAAFGDQQLSRVLATFQACAARDPEDHRAFANLSGCFHRFDDQAASLRATEKALLLAPEIYGYAVAPTVLIKLEWANWDKLDALIETLRAQLNSGRRTNPFLLLNFSDDPVELLHAARSEAAAGRQGAILTPWTPTPPNTGRYRIGYFSSTLRAHTLGFLTRQVFASHGKERFDI